MIKIADIRKAAGIYYGLAQDELRSKKKTRAVSRPRQVAMYLGRAMTDQSLLDLAARFNRDHTSILFAIRQTTMRAAGCEKAAAEIDSVALLAVRCSIDRQTREREWVRRGLAAGEIVSRQDL